MDHTTSHHTWVWPTGGRAFYLAPSVRQAFQPLDRIVSVDTDSGDRVISPRLPEPVYKTPFFNDRGLGNDHVLTFDVAGQRLFLATGNQTSAPDKHVVDLATANARGQTCVGNSGQSTLPKCLTGVSVIDADTLDRVRHIPLRGVQVDAALLSPQLLAMEYAPPHDGLPGKLHLLIWDAAHATHSADAAVARYNPRQAYDMVYAVQLDPENGVADWTVRLDGCRGSLMAKSVEHEARLNFFPHQAAIFRGRAPGERAVYVACHNSSQSFTGSVVRVPLSDEGAATVSSLPGAPEQPGPDDAEAVAPPGMPDRPFVVDGPDRVFQMHADPESGRILMEVVDGRPMAAVWYVFDTKVMQFVGTIGIGGPFDFRTSLSTVARANGRLYVFARSNDTSSFGGLYAADIRRTPIPQALHFPEVAAAFPQDPDQATLDANNGEDTPARRWALVPEALPDGGVRLWMPAVLYGKRRTAYVALEDHRPMGAVILPEEFGGRTLDLEEAEGVTSSTVDGAARAFGFRALLVGGAEAAGRAGPADPVGLAAQCGDESWADSATDPFQVTASVVDVVMDEAESPGLPLTRTGPSFAGPCNRAGVQLPTDCADQTREVILAFVGSDSPAVVDANGGRGTATPFLIDSATGTDSTAPASRCTNQDWDQLWSAALFGKAPVGEPSLPLDQVHVRVECVSASEQDDDRQGDAVADGYSASVSCEGDQASGFAYTRAGPLPGVSVAEAMSSFRVYRDPGRGIVSRVESVARGVSIDGVVRIDTVRGVAESWANGRNQSLPAEAREPGYRANCDMERTAGTCFRRHLFGLWTPGYRCGPCGDEARFVEGANAALNPNVSVRMREPDQRLSIGADNGFTAAIVKPEHERFADLVLNNDLMQTTLPTLEVIRPAPANRPASRQGTRGRQIYQFAGVEVSSSYGISCLLVYDEAANTCVGEKQEPGAITVSLSDSDGKPLAGGGFEVRQDVDADGVLGLKDTLLPEGACVTADDGVGTCTLDNLQPGSYLVSQVAAPPGYAKSAEPFVVELASGEQRTVAFTNVSNVSTIDLKVSDEHGAPLSGAAFAAYPDADSDGKVAPDAKPAAECTTDSAGVCQMKVPAGSYVLVQTSAPGGLEGIEPVPFTFASGGQVAAVSVVNYPPGAPAQPEAPASPVYTPPVDQAPPTEIVDDYSPVPDVPVIVEPPAVSVPERIGGTVTQVIRAPGDALRLLARDPKQAVAWTAALALFVVAAMAVRRRQQATELIRR